jgi:hypothetical protein
MLHWDAASRDSDFLSEGSLICSVLSTVQKLEEHRKDLVRALIWVASDSGEAVLKIIWSTGCDTC